MLKDSDLMKAIDRIVFDVQIQQSLKTRQKILKFLKSKAENGDKVIFSMLDKELPGWRAQSESPDVEEYILSEKLSYRIKKVLRS